MKKKKKEKTERWKGIGNVRIEFYLFSSPKIISSLHYVVQSKYWIFFCSLYRVFRCFFIFCARKIAFGEMCVISLGLGCLAKILILHSTSSNMHGVINTVHKLSDFPLCLRPELRSCWFTSSEQRQGTKKTAKLDDILTTLHYSILVVLSLVIHVRLSNVSITLFSA